MLIYVSYHCKKCYSTFYCDKTCQKNHASKHDLECPSKIRITPNILYPLQVELHCGGDLGDDIEIYFEYEKKISLKYRGIRFMKQLFKTLIKKRWFKNCGYAVTENSEKHNIRIKYNKKADMDEEMSVFDMSISGEEDLYLKMPVVQEVKVEFLNSGAILQDIIKETYEVYTHYIHIFYFPL